MAFLYDTLLQEFGKRAIANVTIPNHISDNLNPNFIIRPYQVEAFQRFIICDTENFEGKPPKPLHLLYNMATGSGKTFVMAGLILHLYQQGYRNFLFFVNSNNIIEKTKDNFMNPSSFKYLFNDKIVFEGKEVLLKEVDNFDESDIDNINLKFTTIQQLHIDLNNSKENSVTFEDFKDRSLVMIADEAHHLVSGTRSGELFGSWEDTVKKIHNANYENILLEFTATIDTETAELMQHYQDKVIFKYDLSQFRIDKFSKEISLVRSLYDENDRILQAIILNLYRQELAASKGINLKPVILFKAKKTIKESELNKSRFHKLIDTLNDTMVDKIRNTSTVEVVRSAFDFFDAVGISSYEIAKRLKNSFRYENCLSANNDTEAEENQILLNTLEDENNPIRAIFAVQKLNEGWDVLNLFDIVRLYDDRDGKNGKPGKTTISEAQLIGRGARYFPFSIDDNSEDRFTRKFDDDVSHELKSLEELYYHTKEDSRYISELKKALIDSGIYQDDDDLVKLTLSIKPEFKESDFYKKGRVVFNRKVQKSFDNVRSFSDLGVKHKNFRHALNSGHGKLSKAFYITEPTPIDEGVCKSVDISVKTFPPNVLVFGLTQNPFFYFDNLLRFFPNLSSISEFIKSDDYLAGLEVTFTGIQSRIENLTQLDYLQATIALLQNIEFDIKTNLAVYEGSDYISEPVHQVFKDKDIKVRKDSERSDGQISLVSNESWYVYNANYGTTEEKKFVELFSRRFDGLNQKFEDIFLVRNEREVKIFDKLGRAFEPDFILFCKQRNSKNLTYQVFIEPKGNHLLGHDKWKEDFLKEIRSESRLIEIHTDTYLITAVPFYNYDNENKFKADLEDTLTN